MTRVKRLVLLLISCALLASPASVVSQEIPWYTNTPETANPAAPSVMPWNTVVPANNISNTAQYGIPDNGIPDITGSRAFAFRSGVTWNMTRDQVRQLEALPLVERNQGEWAILYPTAPVTVSRFQADLVYMFRSDQLKMINYDFGTSNGPEAFLYLAGAMTSVYGEVTVPPASEIVGIMNRIYPGYYTEQGITKPYKWISGSDTIIYLYYYSENAFAILYASTDYSEPAANGGGAYDTTGL